MNNTDSPHLENKANLEYLLLSSLFFFKSQVASKIKPHLNLTHKPADLLTQMPAAHRIGVKKDGGVAGHGVIHRQNHVRGNHLHHLAALCCAEPKPCPWNQAHLWTWWYLGAVCTSSRLMHHLLLTFSTSRRTNWYPSNALEEWLYSSLYTFTREYLDEKIS